MRTKTLYSLQRRFDRPIFKSFKRGERTLLVSFWRIIEFCFFFAENVTFLGIFWTAYVSESICSTRILSDRKLSMIMGNVLVDKIPHRFFIRNIRFCRCKFRTFSLKSILLRPLRPTSPVLPCPQLQPVSLSQPFMSKNCPPQRKWPKVSLFWYWMADISQIFQVLSYSTL